MSNPIRKEYEIRAYVDETNPVLLFGASTPAGVVWLEQTFPNGEWQEDEDGRPLYALPLPDVDFVAIVKRSEGAPPYDAATATGMYDREG